MTGNPSLDERQQTLLRQAKNCRNLAHFLRTDPRVEGHFDMSYYFKGINGWDKAKEFILLYGTTACAAGWGYIAGISSNPVDQSDYCLDNYYGVGKAMSETFSYVFGARSKRTPQEEALVLEEHAAKLEAQI